MLAFLPILASSLALAESKDDYNATVAAAQAKVSAAQEALQKAVEAYNLAVSNQNSTNVSISQAQQNVQNAQIAYDQSLIPDPSWTRPMVEQTYTVSVPTTVQVPYVVSESTTTQETSIIQVPQTQIVTTTTQVAREVTTVVPAGLTAKSYNMLGYNNRPPLPTENRLVATQIVDSINFQWGGGQVLNSGLYEDVIVNFTGNLYAPTTGNYLFYAPADDGTKLIIDGNLIIDDWYDKGGGGSTISTYLTEGSHTITLWYYENGGGANVWLYWATPNAGMTLVPPSAFGQQTITSTVYDTVTTTSEVTIYIEQTVVTDVTVYNDVTYYRQETIYVDELRTRMVEDEQAVQPMIKDASLIPAIQIAQNILDSLIAMSSQNQVIIESASLDVQNKQQELNVAQQELEAIPPFREPTPTPTQTKSPTPEPTKNVVDPTPTPEPSKTPEIQPKPELRVEEAVAEIATLSEIKPENLSDKQVEQLVAAANAVFETAEQGSAAYEQALGALAVAAQADDPQLPPALEAIPGAAQVLEAFNNLGNVGADISPKVREQAKKTVIASVIAAGAAVQAVAATTSVSSSGGGASRRNK